MFREGHRIILYLQLVCQTEWLYCIPVLRKLRAAVLVFCDLMNTFSSYSLLLSIEYVSVSPHRSEGCAIPVSKRKRRCFEWLASRRVPDLHCEESAEWNDDIFSAHVAKGS